MRSFALIAAVVAVASAAPTTTNTVTKTSVSTSTASSSSLSTSTSFTTTTITTTSVVATSTVTTTIGTTTTTVPTPAGFVFVQTSLPGAIYGGSGGGSPANAEGSNVQSAVRRDADDVEALGSNLNSVLARGQFDSDSNNLPVRHLIARTSGAVVTKTVTKTTVTQVTATTTETVASTTSTVWAACATNNFADRVGNRTIINSSGESNTVMAYSRAKNAYECCAIAMSKPVFNVAQQCSAQTGKATAQLGSDAPAVIGNGYCGKISMTSG